MKNYFFLIIFLRYLNFIQTIFIEMIELNIFIHLDFRLHFLKYSKVSRKKIKIK